MTPMLAAGTLTLHKRSVAGPRRLGLVPYVLVLVDGLPAEHDVVPLEVEAGGGLVDDLEAHGLGAVAETLALALGSVASRDPHALAVALEWLHPDVITDLGLTDHDAGS